MLRVMFGADKINTVCELKLFCRSKSLWAEGGVRFQEVR
jgi:hypothetical protein